MKKPKLKIRLTKIRILLYITKKVQKLLLKSFSKEKDNKRLRRLFRILFNKSQAGNYKMFYFRLTGILYISDYNPVNYNFNFYLLLTALVYKKIYINQFKQHPEFFCIACDPVFNLKSFFFLRISSITGLI